MGDSEDDQFEFLSRHNPEVADTISRRNNEVPYPEGNGSVCSFEVIRKAIGPEEKSCNRVLAAEPTPELSPDGLPTDRPCRHCEHLVIDSTRIQKGQNILLSRGRLDIGKANDNGCPFYQWLE